MNSLFLGFIVCFVSFLIVEFICRKLAIEKLINHNRSMQISLFFIAILFNIIGGLIIEAFAIRESQFLLKSFLAGVALYFSVFIFPFNVKKTKI